MNFFFYSLLTLFLLISALLCIVVLIQENKSMGLGVLGGGDMGSSLFGTSTVDVVKKFTAYLSGCFLVLAVVLSLWASVISDNTMSIAPSIEEVQSE